MSSAEAAARPAPIPGRLSNAAVTGVSAAQVVLAVILAGTLVRLLLAAATGLGTDESYTVANARVFDLSYVDYPPLHAWLVGGWAKLCHSEAPFIVRLPFIALFAGSTWMMFRLAALLHGARAGMWAVILFNLAPVFTLAHASWVLPDGPLLFFLLCGALALAKLFFASDAPGSLRGWVAAGTCTGLAMLSKYHGAWLAAAAFIFLLTWPPGRRLLARPGPWLAAGLAALLFAPVIAWNAEHDWAGFFFQAQRLTESRNLSLARAGAGVLGQAAYLSPWLFVPLAALWIGALRRNTRDPRAWFLALLAAGPIVGFTAADLFAKGLPHWPMPGWLFVFPLLGARVAAFAGRKPKHAAFAAAGLGALMTIAALAIATGARTGWIARVSSPAADPTVDLMDWNGVEHALEDRGLLSAAPAVASTHWMDAGKLNYAIGRDIPVLCLCADPQQFRYSSDPAKFAGRDILIIGRHRDARHPDALLAGQFSGFRTLAPIILTRNGSPTIEFAVVLGLNFHPDARLPH